jgi:N-acetyl-gamma-glutamyl-phosphate reductase
MTKIFIDGKEGTTGLRIYERIANRDDLELILLSDEERKDVEARRKALNSCDIAFLCLPDAAARESVSLVDNPNVTIIDASTAHRTDPGFVYGLPELSSEQFDKIASTKRIAVPGCHAGGFVALVKPLVDAGVISDELALTCFSITGYSGGGKKMIAEYEDENRDILLDSPRQYGVSQKHKHLPEMQAIPGLKVAPIFCPIVADYYSGMEVTVPLFAKDVKGGAEAIKEVYRNLYRGPIAKYVESAGENGLMASNIFSGKDTLEVTVQGNEERILLVARFDNLGKGASGAAVECMNISLGKDPTTGLEV